MRTSHGVLALIRREHNGQDEVLLNWNPGWGSYALLGGHMEPEDAGDVATSIARELIEEMGPEATWPDGGQILPYTLRWRVDFEVGVLGFWEPDRPVLSRSHGVLTRYRFDLGWVRFSLPETTLAPLWERSNIFRWMPLEVLKDPARCVAQQVSDFPLPAVLKLLTATPDWHTRWPAAFESILR
jgi:hypothetical protein